MILYFDIIKLAHIHEPTLPVHHHHNLPFNVWHPFIEEVPKQIPFTNPILFHCKEQVDDWQLF